MSHSPPHAQLRTADVMDKGKWTRSDLPLTRRQLSDVAADSKEKRAELTLTVRISEHSAQLKVSGKLISELKV